MCHCRRIHFIALLLSMFMVPVPAATVHRSADSRLLKVQNSDIGANGAARAARRATGGRVLTVRRVRTDNGPAYRVKVLARGGRVRVLLVDATSGTLR